MGFVRGVLVLLRAFFCSRLCLAAENLALRLCLPKTPSVISYQHLQILPSPLAVGFPNCFLGPFVELHLGHWRIHPRLVGFGIVNDFFNRLEAWHRL